MSKGSIWVLWMSMVALLILASNVASAAQYPIDYVQQHAKDLANTKVTVQGLVSDSQVVPPNPMEDVQIIGTYNLTDKTGTLQIQTTKKPPANGEKMKVTGLVRADDTTGSIYLLQKSGFPPEGTPLYIILGVLVVLAIVLVYLLTRGEKSPVVEEDTPVSEPQNEPAIVGQQKTCPNCNGKVPVDDRFCGNCRFDFIPQPATGEKKTVAAPPVDTHSSKPTVSVVVNEPVLADLMVVDGNGAPRGSRFELKQSSQKVKIGRHDSMNIRLDDETVSREHARIWWENGSFYIQDEGSTAGTLVNGEKVARQSLNDNDEIQLGRTKLVFRMVNGKSN